MVHELKTDEVYWQAVREGRKTFEIRINDRNFKVGDILLLRRHPRMSRGSDLLMCVVTYILEGGQYGLSSDYVAMAIKFKDLI